MADLQTFDADELKGVDLTNVLGNKGASAPAASAPASAGSYVTHDQLQSADDLSSVIGIKPSAEPSKDKVIPPEERAREDKINAYSAKAAQQVKEEGETGAFMHGLGNVPLLGPAAQAGKRYYQAFKGEGQGSTVGERVEDLRNQREAYEREVNKQHPYAKLGGELAQVAPMMFIPGVGWAGAAARAGATEGVNLIRAGRAATAAKALGEGASAAEIAKAAEAANEVGKIAKLAPAAAEVAGMGAEGAAWGAASAAGNKYFGTAQPSDQADIGESAKEGALFGSVIGAGGKAIGAAYSKFAPEWWQNARLTPNFIREWIGKDDPILETFMQKQKIDDPDGKWFQKMQEARAAGADVNPLDYRTKSTDAWLQEQFQNHPDALTKLKQELNDRLAGASDRGRNFFKKMAGIPEEGEFNIDKVRTEAQGYADKINRENFAEAYHPDNAAGTWSSAWDGFLKDPSVESALSSFDRKYVAMKGEGYKSPFGRRGDLDISESNLDPQIISHLKDNGVETLSDLAKLRPADVNKIYGYDPNVPSDTGRAFDTKKIYDGLKSGIKGMDLNERVILNPESINAEYLDNLQLYLRNVAKGTGKEGAIPIQRTAAEKINKWADNIVDTLKSQNEVYAQAHETRAQFHRENNALDAGTEFMKNLGNTNKSSRTANEVKNMTPEEKEFFKYGVIDWIHNQGITGGGPTRGAPIDAQLAYRKIQNWLTKPDVEKTLTEVLGKNEFQSFGTFLKGEVLANDSAKRAQDLGARGNLLTHFLRNAYIPGAGGIDWLLGHPALSVPAVAYRIIDFYAGERYARAVANKFTHPDAKEFQAAYDEIYKDPKIRDGINRYMAGLAYGISVQAGESKFNANRVNQATSKMSDDARKFTEDGIKEGMKIAHERLGKGGEQPEQRNMGGRVGYNGGGRTPYDWRQHYQPKSDAIGPVAPKRLIMPGVDADGAPTGGISGYHGSPRRFSKFDDKFLLTGTGRSSYGPPSHYIAQNKSVAMEHMDRDTPGSGEGYLYRVNVAAHPNNFVDWNSEWAEQHPEVVSAVAAAMKDLRVKDLSPSSMKKGYITGEDFYNKLKSMDIPPAEIKAALMSQGIKGVKYFDKHSRERASKFNPRYGKKLSGTRNFAVFDPNDIKIIERHAKGGRVDLWHENHEIHREYGGRNLTQPVDPMEAARQQRIKESGLTNQVYHGTPNNEFVEFKRSNSGYLPLMIGTHVAKDPGMSDYFMKNHDNRYVGNTMPLLTHDDKYFHPVEQPVRGGEPRHDDYSVITEIMHELIQAHPELGEYIISKNRRMHPKEAQKLVKALLANKHFSSDEKKHQWHPDNDLKSYLASHAITAPMGEEQRYAKMYRKMMLKKGFKGLKYKNTSPTEMENAEDPTAYIVFHPDEELSEMHPLRSKFAKFDPAKKMSEDIRDARGGPIRPKRATGGRIPDADKLFKEAKKFVDSRTKGMLDQPDERIVHALRIAKARNG